MLTRVFGLRSRTGALLLSVSLLGALSHAGLRVGAASAPSSAPNPRSGVSASAQFGDVTVDVEAELASLNEFRAAASSAYTSTIRAIGRSTDRRSCGALGRAPA